MGWHWHQLDHIQIIWTALQRDNHASTSPLSFYRPDALPGAQPTASKHHTTPQPFCGPFPRPPRWASARRELLDFMVQGKINRERDTNHPAWHHSIRTNQCPPPPSHFLQAGCPSCHATNSVKALKANCWLCINQIYNICIMAPPSNEVNNRVFHLQNQARPLHSNDHFFKTCTNLHNF